MFLTTSTLGIPIRAHTSDDTYTLFVSLSLSLSLEEWGRVLDHLNTRHTNKEYVS